MSKTKTLRFPSGMTLSGNDATGSEDTTFQESLIKLGTVLPNHLHYSGIEAACRCADMHPELVYELITGGRALPESFCEALLGPDWKAYLTGRM